MYFSNADTKSEIAGVSLIVTVLVTTVLLSGTLSASDFDNVRLELVGGSSIRATIDEIEQDGTVTGKNLPPGIRLDQILQVKSRRSIKKDVNNKTTVLLADGGRVLARSVLINDEKVKIDAEVGPSQFPLESIRAVIWSKTDKVKEVIEQASPDDDAVIVQTDGKQRVINGILEAVTQSQLQIKYKGESRKISLSKINAVVVADLKLKPPSETIATLKLTNGSTLVGGFMHLTESRVALKLAGGSTLEIDSSNVSEITLKSDRVVYLSDITPIEVEQRPLLTLERRWQRDRSIEGNSLTLRFAESDKKVSFEKGLGTHSFCSLVFENTNNYDRFRAVVGIDAETGGRGDCQMVVQGDGIELWSKRVRGSDDPESIAVDITGMKKIALIVRPGEQFDLADHADWADARFTKSK